MSDGSQYLDKISQLGTPLVQRSMDMSKLMEQYAVQAGVPNLAVAVANLDKYYRLQNEAVAENRITRDGRANISFESINQAQQLLISTAAINFGLAYREGFKVKIKQIIEPGGYFGIADTVTDTAELTRKLKPEEHLQLAQILLQTALALK